MGEGGEQSGDKGGAPSRSLINLQVAKQTKLPLHPWQLVICDLKGGRGEPKWCSGWWLYFAYMSEQIGPLVRFRDGGIFFLLCRLSDSTRTWSLRPLPLQHLVASLYFIIYHHHPWIKSSLYNNFLPPTSGKCV